MLRSFVRGGTRGALGWILLVLFAACDGSSANRSIAGPDEGGADGLPYYETSSTQEVAISNVIAASGREYRVITSGLAVGDSAYTDRDFTFGTVPELVAGQPYIRPPNKDRESTGNDSFLRFTIDREAWVYIAYDFPAPPPAWLDSAFTDTGVELPIEWPTWSNAYRLYARHFPAGEVVLGSNREGDTDAKMYIVIIAPGDNQAPLADAGGPYSGTEGTPVSFNGSGSSDPDGHLPLTYAWNFGDGSSGTDVSPKHSYADNGNYFVTLTVTDVLGATSAVDTATVTIGNAAPAVSAGSDTIITAGGSLDLSATFSDSGAADGPWSYTIDWGEVSSAESNSTSDQSSPIAASHPYSTPGTYWVRVSVTDKDNGLGSDSLMVTVDAQPEVGAIDFVATGYHHSCALTPTGEAYCWGNNSNRGQVGDGTFEDRHTPVAVVGGLTFRFLVGGGFHTCGVTTDGNTYCWGLNDHGQIGDGTTNSSNQPVAVLGGVTFTSLAAGARHTCGLATDGQVYCWGWNVRGQLGDGQTVDQLSPVPVEGGHTFEFLFAGYHHTCGIVAGGTAYCWGKNDNGQLGNGTRTDSSTPVAVVGGHTFTTLSAAGSADGGQNHTCALTTDGIAYCWGNNWHNQLGINDSRGNRDIPQAVVGVPTFSWIATGGDHTCGVAASGETWCWGDNLRGQLGGGSKSDFNPPVQVTGGHSFEMLSLGWIHSCGLTTTGDVYCWGRNHKGQLGDGTTTIRRRPTEVIFP